MQETQGRLAEQTWDKVTISRVYHAFLKSEFDRCVQTWGHLAIANKALIDAPNFEDESENCKRAFLLCFRAPLLFRIPSSTIWYKVVSLKESHLNELLVIGRCGWDDGADRNELLNVAKRKPDKLRSVPSEWTIPILWGHAKEGPLTIIEGNHRLVAYAALQTRPELSIRRMSVCLQITVIGICPTLLIE